MNGYIGTICARSKIRLIILIVLRAVHRYNKQYKPTSPGRHDDLIKVHTQQLLLAAKMLEPPEQFSHINNRSLRLSS